MAKKQLGRSDTRVERDSERRYLLIVFGHYLSRALILVGVAVLSYGLAWNYATRRYLEGFSDAIVPLNGSSEQKSQALLDWLRHTPDRRDGLVDQTSSRDPVGVVQDARLLNVCGSASNAFINLAEAAGLKTRRLLLLDASGGTKHVVVEVKWDDRWVVVDPSHRSVFRDHSGRALTKEDLRNPEIFRDAISRVPNYSPTYTFDHTVHIHLTRVPILGALFGRAMTFLFPKWEEAINWGYLPEHPSLWPIFASLPLFLLGIFIRLIVHWYGRRRLGVESLGFRKQLVRTGRVVLRRSA